MEICLAHKLNSAKETLHTAQHSRKKLLGCDIQSTEDGKKPNTFCCGYFGIEIIQTEEWDSSCLVIVNLTTEGRSGLFHFMKNKTKKISCHSQWDLVYRLVVLNLLASTLHNLFCFVFVFFNVLTFPVESHLHSAYFSGSQPGAAAKWLLKCSDTTDLL